ncbi:MAG: Jag N-terminal domain-containing protein, partial [Ktedonobacteraceae bacterium]|nr:Jag N-terminal domain-containing protein [Ktedonobacteraceae bacterium]
MESIEASGKSVDEAIQQALEHLRKRREDVDIVILQEPSRGTFGIGGKEARVRVTVRSSAAAIITPEMADAILGSGDVDVALPEEDATVQVYDDDEEEFEGEYTDEDEEEEVEVPAAIEEALSQSGIPGEMAATNGNEVQEVDAPSREDVEITVDVLQHILRYLNIHATVQVRGVDPLTLNINGIHQNLGLLIGRRGETLAALQLLVNLIVRHRTKHRLRIIVDAENYRLRREENLRSLAQRVAQQVRNYRRSIALEAMPPNERRIVHL